MSEDPRLGRIEEKLDKLADAVVWVQWQCYGLEYVGEQPYSAEVEGEVTLAPNPDQEQYVTFDEFACLWVYDPPVVQQPPPLA